MIGYPEFGWFIIIADKQAINLGWKKIRHIQISDVGLPTLDQQKHLALV